jgi:hypothetical protein
MSVRLKKLGPASLLALSVLFLLCPSIASGSFPPSGGKRSLHPSRDVRDEVDPRDPESCYAMGELDITYSSARKGPPSVGLVITDPRGRRIGHDPIENRETQELPLAQAFIDCMERDDNGELGSCTGTIQICGPVSGSYKVQVLAAETGRYSVNVSGTSQEVLVKKSFRSTDSNTGIQDVLIRKHEQDSLLIRYSREPGSGVEILRGQDSQNASSTPQLLDQKIQ